MRSEQDPSSHKYLYSTCLGCGHRNVHVREDGKILNHYCGRSEEVWPRFGVDVLCPGSGRYVTPGEIRSHAE